MKKSWQNHVKKDKKKEIHGSKKRGSNSFASKAPAKRRRVIDVISRDELPKFSRVPITELFQHRYLLCNQDATQNLFEVVAGLDSLILGEGQILAQVADGKRVRTETNISSGSVSASSTPVELALQKLLEHSSCTACILVVGAGKMGKLMIMNLVAKRCKNMVIVNRAEERVVAIREELTDTNIIYKPFSEILACAAQADVIFTSIVSEAPLFIKDSIHALPSVNSEDRGQRLYIDIYVPLL
ncbi:Glutamyl-tRNA reductase 2, chloroplastic [Capsicum annuum]|nr:Glutamyl-tRNA reductase 2, chloroplastic [Capsicum annuum]